MAADDFIKKMEQYLAEVEDSRIERRINDTPFTQNEEKLLVNYLTKIKMKAPDLEVYVRDYATKMKIHFDWDKNYKSWRDSFLNRYCHFNSLLHPETDFTKWENIEEQLSAAIKQERSLFTLNEPIAQTAIPINSETLIATYNDNQKIVFGTNDDTRGSVYEIHGNCLFNNRGYLCGFTVGYVIRKKITGKLVATDNHHLACYQRTIIQKTMDKYENGKSSGAGCSVRQEIKDGCQIFPNFAFHIAFADHVDIAQDLKCITRKIMKARCSLSPVYANSELLEETECQLKSFIKQSLATVHKRCLYTMSNAEDIVKRIFQASQLQQKIKCNELYEQYLTYCRANFYMPDTKITLTKAITGAYGGHTFSSNSNMYYSGFMQKMNN